MTAHANLLLKTLLASCVLAAILSGCAIYKDLNKPVVSDAEMEQIFHDNKSDFDEIVRMSDGDSSVPRIAFDFTWVSGIGSSSDSGNPGITEERWNEYKTLFRKLRVEGGINREPDGTVAFLAFGRGLSPNGLTKGYLFTKSDRNCTAASLDDLSKFRAQHFVCKHLDENWHLYISK